MQCTIYIAFVGRARLGGLFLDCISFFFPLFFGFLFSKKEVESFDEYVIVLGVS